MTHTGIIECSQLSSATYYIELVIGLSLISKYYYLIRFWLQLNKNQFILKYYLDSNLPNAHTA